MPERKSRAAVVGVGNILMGDEGLDIGVMETLTMERLVHRIPKKIVLIGVEPESIGPSMELSPVLEGKLPGLVQTILGELRTHEEK